MARYKSRAKGSGSRRNLGPGTSALTARTAELRAVFVALPALTYLSLVSVRLLLVMEG